MEVGETIIAQDLDFKIETNVKLLNYDRKKKEKNLDLANIQLLQVSVENVNKKQILLMAFSANRQTKQVSWSS